MEKSKCGFIFFKFLIHFRPMFPFYTPSKLQKTFGVLKGQKWVRKTVLDKFTDI